MISLLHAHSQPCSGILQSLKFLNFPRGNSNEGIDNALSICLRMIFSESANRMKRTRKSATDVVDMRNKDEV